MNLSRTLGALLVTSIGTLAACAGSEDTDTAEGAATTDSIRVMDAPVEICGKDGKDEGCDPCPEIIGDTADKDDKAKENVTYHRVQDVQACTLKSLRSGLKDRVGALISAANRKGFFFPTGGAESRIIVKKISLQIMLAGARTADFQAKRIGGSFTMGDDGDATSLSGGLSVFTAYMPVKIGFVFEDLDNPGIFAELPMQGEYGLVPYFFMKTSMDANLNLGSILSKFGPGSAIGGSLLTALGGNANLQLSASETKMWKEPRCAEASLGATEDQGKRGHYETFDRDFYRNVLEPFCRSYKTKHPEVKCGNTEQPESFASFFESRKLHVAEGCTPVSQPLFGFNTSSWSFLAPKQWGYAAGQETFLYRRTSDPRTWEREHVARVMDVDRQDCGGKKPADDQVCVHVLVENRTLEHYDDEDCQEAIGRAKFKKAGESATTATFAFSQDDASNTNRFIRTPEEL
jgi:hypothetical protein